MSMEKPAWRIEIWHEGLKAAEILNDDFDLVVDDLVQFEAMRREAAIAAATAAAAQATAPQAADSHESVDADAEQAEEENEVDTDAATFWAHFAAAALQRKDMSAGNAATLADELLAEYDKRFTDEA
jgi:hypothetical protein